MIRFRNRIFPDYFIDPETAIITNSKGEVQEVKINKNGRPYFKKMSIHQIQVHTHYGYKKGFDIHHLDENKMNNSLSNLVYLSKSEHMKIHSENRSEEYRRKLGAAAKGNKSMSGKHHTEAAKQKMSEKLKGRSFSEETRRKMSAAAKGKTLSEATKQKLSDSSKDRIWINNGMINKFVKIDEEIPEGFKRGILKK